MESFNKIFFAFGGSKPILPFYFNCAVTKFYWWQIARLSAVDWVVRSNLRQMTANMPRVQVKLLFILSTYYPPDSEIIQDTDIPEVSYKNIQKETEQLFLWIRTYLSQ